jgi:hypothetical protein
VLLEEEETLNTNKLNVNMMDIPFSDGYVSLGVEAVPFLADRPVTIIRFPRHHSNLLLTVHKDIIFVSIIQYGNDQVYIPFFTLMCSTDHAKR